jgi:hypothetical protein
MGDHVAPRSNRAEMRNPLPALPAVQHIADPSPEAQVVLGEILLVFAKDVRGRAQQSWVKNKGPRAACWKAVGAYAQHLRRATKRLSCPAQLDLRSSADALAVAGAEV